MPIARIDHLIAYVDDIYRWHRHLTHDLGFAEAWPVGPFWPAALTSGVALGGLNLELIQPDEGGPSEAEIRTVVFEPIDIVAAEARYAELDVSVRRFEKWEANPDLLRLRGYSDESSRTPQLICTNLIPESEVAFDHFLCAYEPFLYARLHPSSAELRSPFGAVKRLVAEHPKPRLADALMSSLSTNLPIPIDWQSGSNFRVTGIQLHGNEIPALELPSTFRFTPAT